MQQALARESTTSTSPANRRSVQWTNHKLREPGPLDDLTGWGGVVSVPALLRMDGWMHPSVRCWTAELGDVLQFRRLRYRRTAPRVTTSGRGWDDDAAACFIAVCEGLERESLFACDDADFLHASAEELGSKAMDTDRMAGFSQVEIARSGGLLARFEPDRLYRWCEGVDLHTGDTAYVPVVMAFLPLELLEGERFVLALSTGAALHATMEQAIVAGIFEAVERDAAALCWLHKLFLPVLDPDVLRPETTELIRWFSERGVRTLLFDATTDLGVPAVWCLQVCDNSERVAQTAGTAAALDSATAAHKAVLECTNPREGHQTVAPPPRAYRQFEEITSGAVHMSRRSRRPAFDFLVNGLEKRRRSPGLALPGGTPTEQLAALVATLARHRQPAYAVDLTSREASQAGFAAVRVVLPRLVPMSLLPVGKYSATPRLYEAPLRMGYPARSESGLNSYPMPLG